MKKSHLILILSAVVLVCGGAVGIWKKEGIKHRISVWRASSLSEKSEALQSEGDWSGAYEVSLAAWQLDHGNIAILRGLYESALKSGSPRILSVSQALFSHPDSNPQEKIGVIRLFLSLGDHVTVGTLLAQLTPKERSLPDSRSVGAEFLLARNQQISALKILDSLRAERNEPRDLLLTALALSRLSSEGELARGEAQKMIDQLIALDVDPEVAFRAFLILDQMPVETWNLSLFQNLEIRLVALARGGELPLPASLLLARWNIEKEPEQREKILAEVIESFFDQDRERVADWFIRLGEVSYVKGYVSREEALSDPSDFGILIKCLFREGNWEEASELLQEAPPGLNPAVRFALHAVVATANEEPASSKNWWERAMRQAELSSGRGDFMVLARLAATAGNEEVRNRAVMAALKRPSAIPIPAADVSFLFSHLADEGSDSDLLEISLGMLRQEPNNPMLVNNVAWLTLMNGRSASALMEQLSELVEKYPRVSALRTTLALAYQHEGRTDAARATLEDWITDASEEDLASLSSTDLAVLRLVDESLLSGSGAPADSQADFSEMMPVERSFFEAALAY